MTSTPFLSSGPFITRTPEDVLAVVPIVLGFHPEDSVVILTYGGRRQFHARIDLPETPSSPEQRRNLAEILLGPAARERAESVVIAIYSADAALATAVVADLAAKCRKSGIAVVMALRVDGGRWWNLADRHDTVGNPFDVETHPFRVRAVLEGRPVGQTRDAVVARVARDEAGAAAVLEAIREVAAGCRDIDLEVAEEVIEDRAQDGESLSNDEAAAVLIALSTDAPTLGLWWGMTMADAAHRIDVWCDLLRRTPEDFVAEVAGITAMIAWLSGDGALAWCAVDRGRVLQPAHRTIDLVVHLLETGVAPIQDWGTLDGVFPASA